METTNECIENSSVEICCYYRCSYLLLIDKHIGLEYDLNRVNIRILPGMPMCKRREQIRWAASIV